MTTNATLRRRSLLLLVAALASTPFAAACSGLHSSSATTTLTSTVAGGKSLSVAIENGRIEMIQDPTATDLQISAEIRCYGKDQAEADARLKASSLVAQADSSGQVQISVLTPKRTGSSWLSITSDVTHVTVRAADLSGIKAVTSNGAITLGAFAGPAVLETSNGAITVRNHAGPVTATTSNGSITVAGAPSVVAETSNGNVDVTLASGATGDLNLETSNGSITLELSANWEGTVTAQTSLGSVNLSGGSVTGKGESKTMTVGDAAKAKATAETSLGSVTVRPARQ